MLLWIPPLHVLDLRESTLKREQSKSEVALPRIGYKKFWLISPLLLESSQSRSKVPCCKYSYAETQMARRLISPANNQQGPQACQKPHAWAWKQTLPQWSFEMTAVLVNIWLQPYEWPWIRHTTPRCLTHRNCGTINVCCFKLGGNLLHSNGQLVQLRG